ncbi:hypothetical protein F1C16_03775 [Hymenobacter sp. NBH84]|uniref:aspartyl protease family protein n=1 Tax=Hymenobacter sp. NBH84 TaxID=2596915 RepID=UPI0016259760|nr:aspartyl protease family protein [Hymenobacter sp. NBH84]QNE38734.1 hypothetical protein F1C16_03775 [Hymenobacter sp. NBH84]
MLLVQVLTLIFQGSRLWLLAALLLSAGPLVAQEKPAFRFERPRARRISLPFLLQRNLVIVSARLNGQGPYNFLLDSGVGISILTDPAVKNFLQLRTGEEIRLMGAGESEQPLLAYRVDSVQVQLPGAVAPALTFFTLSEDILNLSAYVGMPIHGILGYDVFQSFVVEIHADPALLYLHDPTRYRAPRSRRWARIPLTLRANRTYLTTAVQLNDTLTMPLKLLLDTGAGHALSLETGSASDIPLPQRRLRAQLGLGLSGNINGYLARVQSMQLGRYRVKSLLTSFPDAQEVRLKTTVPRDGGLGFELLKRFTTIIDYQRGVLLLRPNALYHDPFEHDMSGIDLLAVGTDYHRYLILKVEPGSPAAAAGLQPDDELLIINMQPTGNMTLTQISRLLHSGDKRELIFIVRRPNGELFSTSLRLKRQI